MDSFDRTTVGYHGCTEEFANEIIQRRRPIREWKFSANTWDWLGRGIYFWEHAPSRAFRWAQEKYTNTPHQPAVLGAIIRLDRCFDLLDESITAILGDSYVDLTQVFADQGLRLPRNRGRDRKRRELDCLVINRCLRNLRLRGVRYDTVRGAFLEGKPAYPGAGFARESHIQVAVRSRDCIRGVFLPTMEA